MGKNVWLWNHHATGMSFNKGGRHYWFAQHLLKRGYKPTVFCANARRGNEAVPLNGKKFKRSIVDGIPFVYVKTIPAVGNGPKRVLGMFFFYKNLFPVAKAYAKTHGKPDVILASSVHPLTMVAGIQIAKKFKVPCICEVRDLWPETLVTMGRLKRKSPVARLLYALEKYIYKRADKLIFTMPGGKDYVEGIGLESDKVVNINNGVDLEEFHKNRKEYIFADSDLEQAGTFKVVYTGSMGQANALWYLLEAAEIIRDRGLSNIKFLLFGDGYQRTALEKFVKEKDLTNIIFKGRVEKRYVPSILARADLNIFTGQNISLYQYGISLNKMFEYFASGKPTLSNLECCYDLLHKYQCGITVQGGSPPALADGIIRFYEMPKGEYKTYCQNADEAAKEFDFKVLTDKLEKVILDVL